MAPSVTLVGSTVSVSKYVYEIVKNAMTNERLESKLEELFGDVVERARRSKMDKFLTGLVV